ncbi:hypothetical protein L1049_006365 [Liquidambar formosana]|uniref:RHOMBOID-like protein n=1 Tax=Liquidambar formosana TaxID=63359 RepID=A0AAP0RH27_LIQFO
MPKSSPLPSDIESAGPHMAARPPPPPCNPYFSPPPRKSWFPWLVLVLFWANIGIFVGTMKKNNCPERIGADSCVFYAYLGRYSFQPLDENPLYGPSTTTLEDLGGLERKRLLSNGEGWQLWTCIWLHAGVIHLLANMFSLLVIGIRLENEFGFLRIGALYVLSGFGGSLLSALTLSSSVSVGASGALFGLLGAMISELITNWTIYTNKCAALFTLVIVVALNMALGILLPRVDNSAHIGGFLSGFLLGFILLVRPQYGYVSRKYFAPGHDIEHMKSKYKFHQYLLWVTALVILIIGYAIGLVKLF